MRKKLPLLLLFCIVFISKNQAQTNFENGYIINSKGEKTNVLIENENWKKNPETFIYKLSEDAKIKTGRLGNIRAFGIGEKLKYVKASTKIDRDIYDLQTSVNNESLILKEETLFLKVLVEGEVSLYHLEDGKLNLYFIKSPLTNKIEQLVFKTYASQDDKIKYNNFFRKQLYDAFKAEKFDRSRLRNVDYKRSDLINIFESYNLSHNEDVVVYRTNRKLEYNLYVRAGIGFNGLSATSPSGNRDLDFGDESNLRFGFEFEVILPFNNNKWSLFVSPTYQSYSSEGTRIIAEGLPSEREFVTTADYSSIEMPIGLRHYLFLNNKSKIYLNAAAVIDFALDGTIDPGGSEQPLEVSSFLNFAFGIGYQYDNFGVEVLTFANRNIVNDFVGWNSDYSSLALHLTYKFL